MKTAVSCHLWLLLNPSFVMIQYESRGKQAPHIMWGCGPPNYSCLPESSERTPPQALQGRQPGPEMHGGAWEPREDWLLWLTLSIKCSAWLGYSGIWDFLPFKALKVSLLKKISNKYTKEYVNKYSHLKSYHNDGHLWPRSEQHLPAPAPKPTLDTFPPFLQLFTFFVTFPLLFSIFHSPMDIPQNDSQLVSSYFDLQTKPIVIFLHNFSEHCSSVGCLWEGLLRSSGP